VFQVILKQKIHITKCAIIVIKTFLFHLSTVFVVVVFAVDDDDDDVYELLSVELNSF